MKGGSSLVNSQLKQLTSLLKSVVGAVLRVNMVWARTEQPYGREIHRVFLNIQKLHTEYPVSQAVGWENTRINIT